MSINIKRNQLKRVVIVGGGLGGLRLAEDLSKANLQVVLIDKNNFHQFPPLIYQIASAGIDPSSIINGHHSSQTHHIHVDYTSKGRCQTRT